MALEGWSEFVRRWRPIELSSVGLVEISEIYATQDDFSDGTAPFDRV